LPLILIVLCLLSQRIKICLNCKTSWNILILLANIQPQFKMQCFISNKCNSKNNQNNRRPIWPLHAFTSRPSTIINQKIVDFCLGSHGYYKLVYNFFLSLKQNSYFNDSMSNLKLIIMFLSPTLYPLLVEYL
jgi:hypothetical protein